MRPDPHAHGWQFPSEANTYALARVRVILHEVDRLSKSAFRVLAVEQEISARVADARRRLAALEALRS